MARGLRDGFCACVAVILAMGQFHSKFAAGQEADGGKWNRVSIPAAWKEPPSGSEYERGGFAWFRCAVEIPDTWSGQDLDLYVEAVDDAREVFVNGVSVGQFGTFPPEYRSGLGQDNDFPIPARLVLAGQPNIVAIRVYLSDARTNFNVAAPVLFAEQQAIRLAGEWEHRPGDDPKWSRTVEGGNPLPTFSELVDAASTKATLKQLSDEIGPLPPADAVLRFKTPPDLAVEVVVSDPDIGQPLSFKFDERGRLWVVQYLQYPNPAGLTAVSRDKFLRTVYDQIPPAPPNHFPGLDKITIHEDLNLDGYFETQKTFVEGLSLVSSFAFGRGGVWVLNPPYLLFYADRDRDDRPDGDPEVHLTGFGIEDSHSIANSLRWGPDGWLYGAHGSTVTGVVKHPESKTAPVYTMGQAIWRYHPERRHYEIFAEGGGNSFGVEMDSQGRIFSGHNGGDTRGFHFVQGGYYQKGFGKHGELSNPYAFGYFLQMKHPNVARFTHDLLVYEATNLPERYHGKVFGVAPLQNHLTISERLPNGSSFQTHDIGHAWTTDDTWCRPVHLQAGPDGAIYVADFYEQRIDHASHYQGRVDKNSGRIYRLFGASNPSRGTTDLSHRTSRELLETLQSPNRWLRETTLRLVADRRDETLIEPLRQLLDQSDNPYSLDALWALAACGGLDTTTATRMLGHSDPFVRLWTVRLLGDHRQVAAEMVPHLVNLAIVEPHVEVRSQLAASARRLPSDQSIPILRQLLQRNEDLDDIHLPLLLWWAIESKISETPALVLDMLMDSEVWTQPIVQQFVLERVMRRLAQSGTQQDLIACARLLRHTRERGEIDVLLKGFEAAFQGRSLVALPRELIDALTESGGGSLTLRLRRGEPTAVAESLATIADQGVDLSIREQLLDVLGELGRTETVAEILSVAQHAPEIRVRTKALMALHAFDDPSIGNVLIGRFRVVPSAEQAAIQALLASRASWTKLLLSSVEVGQIEKTSITPEIVRRLTLHTDPTIVAKVRELWGEVPGATTAEMKLELERLQRVLSSAAGNPYRGKNLYATNCGKCHVLFGEGQTVGPDLTNYQRDDLNRLLLQVVNPSSEIREGFENTIVAMADGRVLSGFVLDQDNRVVVLRGSNGETYVLAKEDIEDQSAVAQSLMPTGLLQSLGDQEIRDLFAYLRATQPLN
jgi:putative heme-binding domain-containing protein